MTPAAGADRVGLPVSRRGQAGLAILCCAAVAAALLLSHHPLVPVLAGLAPLAAVVALRQPFLPCLGFIIFSFFRIHEVFPFLTPLHIPQMLAIGALAALATQLACGRLKVYWARELTLFMLFFALVTIGLLFATNRGVAMDSWQGTYVKIAVMVLAIVWLARGPREFALTARAMIVAGIVVGAVALVNKVQGVGLIEGTRVTIGRDIGSMLGDPNDLALVLLFPIGFALAQATTRGIRWPWRLLGGLCFVVAISAVVATQSRGGLLGAAAVVAMFAHRRIKSKALILAGVGLGLAVLFSVADIAGRTSGGGVETGIDDSSMGRLHAWEAAVRMGLAHPVTGVGINNYLANYWKYTSHWDGKNHAVHSTWLGVLAETGVLGFVLFLSIVVTAYRSAAASERRLALARREAPRRHAETHALAQALVCSLVGFAVSGTFLTQAFTWPLYILLALTIALHHHVGGSALGPIPARRPPSA